MHDDVLLFFQPPHVHFEPRVPEAEPFADLTLRESHLRGRDVRGRRALRHEALDAGEHVPRHGRQFVIRAHQHLRQELRGKFDVGGDDLDVLDALPLVLDELHVALVLMEKSDGANERQELHVVPASPRAGVGERESLRERVHHDDRTEQPLRGLVDVNDPVSVSTCEDAFEGLRCPLPLVNPLRLLAALIHGEHEASVQKLFVQIDRRRSHERRHRAGHRVLVRHELAGHGVLAGASDCQSALGLEELERVRGVCGSFIRTNYRHLVTILREKQNGIRVVATLKEAHEICTKKEGGADRALDFLSSRLPLLQSLTAPTPKTIPFTDASGVFEPLGPIPWLCEGVRLAPGGVAMWAGYGFSGKTIAAQDLALSVMSRQPWLGIYPVRQGRVLHLDFEQGSRITRERYQRLARDRGINQADLADRMCVSIMPKLYLDTDDAEDMLTASCEGFALVIIDSLKAACPDTEENASSVRKPLDMLARVSERTGAVMLVIDHSRKPKQDETGASIGAKYSIRGNSAKYDALTTAFIFSGEKGKPSKVEHEKCRHVGATITTFGFRVVDVEIDGDPRGGVRLEHLEAHELDAVDQGQAASDEAAKVKVVHTKILAFLGANPEGFVGNRSELRTACDGGQNTIFSRALRRLEEGKRVTVAKGCIRLVPEDAVVTSGAANGVAANGVAANGVAANDADYIHDLYNGL
jgi:hypothetical protein